MKKYLALGFALALGACNHYALVPPQRTTVAGTISVDPQIAWNRYTPPTDRPDRVVTWTADGLLLDSVRFVLGVGDGEPLFQLPSAQQGKITLPLFKSNMEPQEVMELVESTLSRMTNAATATRGLQPAKFGALDGFRFEMDITPRDEVARTALVAGAVRDKKLLLIIYQAATLHYYPKYLAQVERMIESVQIVQSR
jgi:hypothetical protein